MNTRLLKGLLRVASLNPANKKELLPKIAKLLKIGDSVQASVQDKRAAQDTADFAAWAIMRGKRYSVDEVKVVLDRLQIPFIEPKDRKPSKSGPLQIGETVYADKNKNTNELNTDACRIYHLKSGQVELVDKEGVVVRFEDNKIIRFFGPNKPGKALGISRGIPASAVTKREVGKAQIEVIYISEKGAPVPSKTSVEQVLAYVEKGELKGEKRNKSFYTGLCLKQTIGAKGYYFTVFAQQRDKFPRSMNPKSGEVLYLGRLGGRPGGWKAEYADMLAASQVTTKPSITDNSSMTDSQLYTRIAAEGLKSALKKLPYLVKGNVKVIKQKEGAHVIISTIENKSIVLDINIRSDRSGFPSLHFQNVSHGGKPITINLQNKFNKPKTIENAILSLVKNEYKKWMQGKLRN